MVTPLLIISAFLDGKMPGVKLLRKCLFTVKLFRKEYGILTGNLIASWIFLFTGWLILVLTLQGKLAMGSLEGFTNLIKNTATQVDKLIGNNPLLNVVFIVLVIGFLYWISRVVRRGGKKH